MFRIMSTRLKFCNIDKPIEAKSLEGFKKGLDIYMDNENFYGYVR